MELISSNKRILEDVLPLRIIREVEKWPVIYQKDSPEMTNPHFKSKVWEEIAKNLFENYEIYSEEEKQAKVTGLMKRWRNLRDTFKRHLMVEKKNRAGYNIKKKEYVYYKHMSFLLPHMGEPAAPTATAGPARRVPRRRPLAPAAPAAPVAPAPLAPIEYIDEDKHFLLSLLPSFKRMSEDEKLTAKMEILKVIKDVKNSSMTVDFVVDDTLALPSERVLAHDSVTVKKELLSVESDDFKCVSDYGASAGDSD